MRRTTLYTCILMFFAFTHVNAQLIGDLIDPNYNNRTLRNEKLTEIDGTPFYLDEWNVGEIKTKLGNVYPNMKVKYEAYSDQLFFLSEDNIERALAREKIDFFQFNDSNGKSYLFRHIPYHGFMLVLYENDVLLYKKIKKELKEAPPANGYNNTVKRDEFILQETYYVAPSKDEIIVPAESRKQYLELFPSLDDQLNKFMKKNKVRFKDNDRMIELVRYTEELKGN